jgi:hypothetical protein
MHEGRFRDAMVALADSQRTVFVLVTRPEKRVPSSKLRERRRS